MNGYKYLFIFIVLCSLHYVLTQGKFKLVNSSARYGVLWFNEEKSLEIHDENKNTLVSLVRFVLKDRRNQ